MGVDYDAVFGIGVEVKINEDKLPNLDEFDDFVDEFLAPQLKDTSFRIMEYGDRYSEEYLYALVLKRNMSILGVNLQQYKDEIDNWLSHQEIFEKTSDFGLVGGLLIR